MLNFEGLKVNSIFIGITSFLIYDMTLYYIQMDSDRHLGNWTGWWILNVSCSSVRMHLLWFHNCRDEWNFRDTLLATPWKVWNPLGKVILHVAPIVCLVRESPSWHGYIVLASLILITLSTQIIMLGMLQTLLLCVPHRMGETQDEVDGIDASLFALF